VVQLRLPFYVGSTYYRRGIRVISRIFPLECVLFVNTSLAQVSVLIIIIIIILLLLLLLLLLLCPVAVETAGTWNGLAIELVQEIGRRITAITEDTMETVFLFQRLSMAVQQGNAVAFQNTMSTE